MIDPLSPLTAPPPRYLLESDSSDEEGQGVYGGHHASRTSPAPGPRVQVLPLGDDPLPAVDSVVVGVGQAGKYLLRRAGARQAVLEVELDGHRLGAAFVVPGGLFIGLHDADKGDAAFSVVQELTTLVKAKNWWVEMVIPHLLTRVQDRVLVLRSFHVHSRRCRGSHLGRLACARPGPRGRQADQDV